MERVLQTIAGIWISGSFGSIRPPVHSTTRKRLLLLEEGHLHPSIRTILAKDASGNERLVRDPIHSVRVGTAACLTL